MHKGFLFHLPHFYKECLSKINFLEVILLDQLDK